MVVSILALCGCVYKPHPPVETSSDHGEFFQPYRDTFATVAEGKSPDRQLVQLGLPDKDTIVLWYAKGADSTSDHPLTIDVNGQTVPKDRIRHYSNQIHKTGRIEVNGLKSGTAYTVKVAGAGLKAQDVKARTRSLESEPFSFLFGSCFAPYRYDGGKSGLGTWIDKPEQASMLNFRDRAIGVGVKPPAFFLGMGDQLYVDPGAAHRKTSGLAYLHGKRSEKLRGTLGEVPTYLNSLYRLHYAIPAMDEAFQNLPAVLMWDDHDIRDGWGSHGDETLQGWRTYYQYARDAFVAFQASRNPDFAKSVNANGWSPERPKVSIANDAPPGDREIEELDFSFDHGMATFFVADGRSAKTQGPIFTGRQRDRVVSWLKNPALKDRPQIFVFSYPVPVAGNVSKPFLIGRGFSGGNQDDLHDRIHSKDREFLLNLFADHFVDHPRHTLVILSGDVHYSGIQSLKYDSPERGNRVFGYEIISSGMAQTDYNTQGGFWGTVAGYPRGIQMNERIWIQDHGMYSGPCFAELFVSPPDDAKSAPKLGLEFHAAGFSSVPGRGEGREAYRLSETRFPNGVGRSISDYPPNEKSKWGRTTINSLPSRLRDWSLDPKSSDGDLGTSD